ncbi:hypothetical protein GGR36_004318 [Niveibacterium umoris]|uniref:Uncharacterized protein n=1 Tax=Niveibacterium umoris TaxID=1193620 RepID=A0A840BPM5_9RHOO|nr:hypothetical protein [Niveibacterium umoris]
MALGQEVTAAPNKSVNGTPKCYAFGFPRLRLGARYFQR